MNWDDRASLAVGKELARYYSSKRWGEMQDNLRDMWVRRAAELLDTADAAMVEECPVRRNERVRYNGDDATLGLEVDSGVCACGSDECGAGGVAGEPGA